jgi:hypothetical protein
MRNILLNNVSLNEINIIIKNISFDINEYIMSRELITNILYISKKNNVEIDIKDLLDNYADYSQNYKNNTVKNILKIKGIPDYDDYEIKVKKIGLMDKVYNGDTIEKHIMEIYK